MHPHLYILLYFLLFTTNLARLIEIKCPSHCKCDIFEKLKRATCTNRNLAVIQSNLPQQTEVLDLSYNQISHLDDNIFTEQNLVFLKVLNISHNKVSQIHINAFEGLENLKTLDLSYNAIQYLLQNWFWSLQSLKELYLRGNSFGRFNDVLFNSKTLKRLDVSNCRISYLGKTALIGLPNLEVLDISGNYLIHLDVDSIKPLGNLNILNLMNNTLSCDEKLENLTKYCVHQGIKFQNPCQKSVSDSDKFQRIVNMVEPEDEKNSWIYDDEKNIKNITEIIYKCNDTREDKSLLQEIVDLSPTLSILIPFIYGIAVGLLIGCTVKVCCKNKSPDLNENTYVSFDEGDTHLRRRRRFTRAASSEERQSLPLKEWKLSESTPVLYRKNQVNLL